MYVKLQVSKSKSEQKLVFGDSEVVSDIIIGNSVALLSNSKHHLFSGAGLQKMLVFYHLTLC